MSNKRTCVCGVSYNIGPNAGGGYSPYSCKCVGSKPQGKVIHYATYQVDVPVRDTQGHIRYDANGNQLLYHRKGDIILDTNGQPLIIVEAVDTIYTGASRRQSEVEKVKCSDTLPKCNRTHFDNFEYMGDTEFAVIFEAVAIEKMRRIAGGKPKVEEMTVARL